MTYMFTHRTPSASYILLFFFNETATTEIYTLSLPDALPIHQDREYRGAARARRRHAVRRDGVGHRVAARDRRRETHLAPAAPRWRGPRRPHPRGRRDRRRPPPRHAIPAGARPWPGPPPSPHAPPR